MHGITPVRDRIREFRRVSASQLQPHPRNWRIHPATQQAALQTVLEKIGYADALLVRETETGELQILDGHLRASLTPEETVPVLVLDLSADEADYLLATHDPLTSMAETNADLLNHLSQQLSLEQTALSEQLQKLIAQANPLEALVTQAGASRSDLSASATKPGVDVQAEAADDGAPAPAKNCQPGCQKNCRSGCRKKTQPVELPEVFHVVVQCRDELHQQAVYEQLSSLGHSCRVVLL